MMLEVGVEGQRDLVFCWRSKRRAKFIIFIFLVLTNN